MMYDVRCIDTDDTLFLTHTERTRALVREALTVKCKQLRSEALGNNDNDDEVRPAVKVIKKATVDKKSAAVANEVVPISTKRLGLPRLPVPTPLHTRNMLGMCACVCV